MLVASMNPSPNGYFNNPDFPMTSSPVEMQQYLSKVSGPLLDRIDIHISEAIQYRSLDRDGWLN